MPMHLSLLLVLYSIYWLNSMNKKAVLVGMFIFRLVYFVISSIGFGGGVDAIVQPIHPPMKRIATNPTKTGTAMTQN
jgi:hypothetical protein